MEADEPIEPTTAELANSVVDIPVKQAPRRFTRVRTEPERFEFLIDDDQNITLLENDELESYDEVLKSSERDLWLKAMKSKMDSMPENNVWTLSDALEGVKPIGCKWVLPHQVHPSKSILCSLTWCPFSNCMAFNHKSRSELFRTSS